MTRDRAIHLAYEKFTYTVPLKCMLSLVILARARPHTRSEKICTCDFICPIARARYAITRANFFFSFFIFSLVFSFSLFSQNNFYKCCLFLQLVFTLYLCVIFFFLCIFFFLFPKGIYFFSFSFLFEHPIGNKGNFPLLTHSKSKNKITFDSLFNLYFSCKNSFAFLIKKNNTL